MSAHMTILINGQAQHVPTGITIAQLIERLGLPARQVAIEVNQEVVSRDCHGSHVLQPQDALEIVTLVGGG